MLRPDGACSAPIYPQPTSPPPAYVLLITSTMHRTCSAAEQHCGLLQHDVNREAPTSRPCFQRASLQLLLALHLGANDPADVPAVARGRDFTHQICVRSDFSARGGRRGIGHGSGMLTRGPSSCSSHGHSTANLRKPAKRRQSERRGASAHGARAGGSWPSWESVAGRWSRKRWQRTVGLRVFLEEARVRIVCGLGRRPLFIFVAGGGEDDAEQQQVAEELHDGATS